MALHLRGIAMSRISMVALSSDCKTTGTVTAKHYRYPSGQPRPTSKGAEAAAADLVMRRTLEFEAPAARTSNAGPDSAIMIDSSGDPISGRGVGCWRLMSIQARGCMLMAIHLRRDRRKEQQQQLASYMTEYEPHTDQVRCPRTQAPSASRCCPTSA